MQALYYIQINILVVIIVKSLLLQQFIYEIQKLLDCLCMLAI